MLINNNKRWVKHLSDTELPVLAHTLERICSLTSDSKTTVNSLAKAILEDPDLTSSVIKLANSACYNPGNTIVSTISRAVMVIGFESVKSIAIAATLVDKLQQGRHRDRLYRCLVRSFHGAMQAKYLASSHSSTEQEEVFVAALLFDIGEAAFWASDQPQVANYSQKLDQGLESTADLQHQVIGASFHQISRGLIRLWKLGPLLEESIERPSSHLAQIVKTATSIAKVAEQGWDPARLTSTVKASSKLLANGTQIGGKDDKAIQKELRKNAERAAVMAEKLGIKKARKYLFDGKPGTQPVLPTFDSDIQIKSLQGMSSQIAKRAPVRDILNELIQGIYRGVGMERVGLFLSRPQSPNFYLGSAEGLRQDCWQIGQAIEKTQDTLLQHIKKSHCCFIKMHDANSQAAEANHTLAPFSHIIQSLVAPLDPQHPEKGFIYADNLGKSPITDEQFDSFKLFILQLQLYIQYQGSAA